MNNSVSTFPIEREFTRVQKKDIELGWFSISHNFIYYFFIHLQKLFKLLKTK